MASTNGSTGMSTVTPLANTPSSVAGPQGTMTNSNIQNGAKEDSHSSSSAAINNTSTPTTATTTTNTSNTGAEATRNKYDGDRSITVAISANCPPSLRRDVWSVEDFELKKLLYNGGISMVYHAVDRRSGITIALKLYKRTKLNEIERYQIAREIRLHAALAHESVIGLFSAWKDRSYVYLALEWAPGGDVYQFLRSQGGKLSEETAVLLILDPFIQGIQALHAKGLIHRDIKPENILLTSSFQVKISDFGLSIDWCSEVANTRLGTINYLAPEILDCPVKTHPLDHKDNPRVGYTNKVDCWSIGVLTYELLTGRAPFEASSTQDTLRLIRTKEIVYPPGLSPDAVSFLKWVLNRNPNQRPFSDELNKHPWFRRIIDRANELKAERAGRRFTPSHSVGVMMTGLGGGLGEGTKKKDQQRVKDAAKEEDDTSCDIDVDGEGEGEGDENESDNDDNCNDNDTDNDDDDDNDSNDDTYDDLQVEEDDGADDTVMADSADKRDNQKATHNRGVMAAAKARHGKAHHSTSSRKGVSKEGSYAVKEGTGHARRGLFTHSTGTSSSNTAQTPLRSIPSKDSFILPAVPNAAQNASQAPSTPTPAASQTPSRAVYSSSLPSSTAMAAAAIAAAATPPVATSAASANNNNYNYSSHQNNNNNNNNNSALSTASPKKLLHLLSSIGTGPSHVTHLAVPQVSYSTPCSPAKSLVPTTTSTPGTPTSGAARRSILHSKSVRITNDVVTIPTDRLPCPPNGGHGSVMGPNRSVSLSDNRGNAGGSMANGGGGGGERELRDYLQNMMSVDKNNYGEGHNSDVAGTISSPGYRATPYAPPGVEPDAFAREPAALFTHKDSMTNSYQYYNISTRVQSDAVLPPTVPLPPPASAVRVNVHAGHSASAKDLSCSSRDGREESDVAPMQIDQGCMYGMTKPSADAEGTMSHWASSHSNAPINSLTHNGAFNVYEISNYANNNGAVNSGNGANNNTTSAVGGGAAATAAAAANPNCLPRVSSFERLKSSITLSFLHRNSPQPLSLAPSSSAAAAATPSSPSIASPAKSLNSQSFFSFQGPITSSFSSPFKRISFQIGSSEDQSHGSNAAVATNSTAANFYVINSNASSTMNGIASGGQENNNNLMSNVMVAPSNSVSTISNSRHGNNLMAMMNGGSKGTMVQHHHHHNNNNVNSNAPGLTTSSGSPSLSLQDRNVTAAFMARSEVPTLSDYISTATNEAANGNRGAGGGAFFGSQNNGNNKNMNLSSSASPPVMLNRHASADGTIPGNRTGVECGDSGSGFKMFSFLPRTDSGGGNNNTSFSFNPLAKPRTSLVIKASPPAIGRA